MERIPNNKTEAKLKQAICDRLDSDNGYDNELMADDILSLFIPMLTHYEKMRSALERIVAIEDGVFGLKAFDVKRFKADIQEALNSPVERR